MFTILNNSKTVCFLPEDICRKKWKGLRDTYLKDKKKETNKRSGSADRHLKKSKFPGVFSFLDPIVTPRETSSNMAGGLSPVNQQQPRTRVQSQKQDHHRQISEVCLQLKTDYMGNSAF